MARDLSAYREVALQIVGDAGGGRPGARPLSGQAFAPDLRVHGGGALARVHPVGSIVLVQAKLTDRRGGPPFLYVYPGDPVQRLTPEAARRWLEAWRRLRL